MTLDMIFISFIFYSICGWLYEATVCSLWNQHRLINRGFLLGPYCPVYGTGAVACWLCFGTIKNPIVLLVVSMILCGMIEYITGYLMEKIFHTKWWDYTKYPFQLHGRVCLYGLLIFGVANVIVCYLIQPVLLMLLVSLPEGVLHMTATLTALILLFDIVTTMSSWMKLNKNLQALYCGISHFTDNSMQEFSNRLLKL